MAEPLVRIEEPRPGVAHVILNRPEKRNALSIVLMDELCAVLDGLIHDRRVVVLRGAGPVFCAGLDLVEAGDLEKAHASAEAVARTLRTLWNAPCVTIAAVHGAAAAGGAGLMTACDFAFAAADTRIGYPEVRRGLVAGLVMTFLRRRVNERDARELLLRGHLIDAEAACAMGLLSATVPAEALDAEVNRCIDDILRAAPGAVARTKAMLDAIAPRSVEADLQIALDAHMAARTSPEAQEGMRAFVEKRPPEWEGGSKENKDED